MTTPKTGFLQELQSDGSVANSLIRLLEILFFALLVIYTCGSTLLYQVHFQTYGQLLKDTLIDKSTYMLLIKDLVPINWDIFLILITATVAPKVIQKFAEAKTGISDSPNSSTESKETTTKEVKTTN